MQLGLEPVLAGRVHRVEGLSEEAQPFGRSSCYAVRRAQKGKGVRHKQCSTRRPVGFEAIFDPRDSLHRPTLLGDHPAAESYAHRLPLRKAVLGSKRNQRCSSLSYGWNMLIHGPGHADRAAAERSGLPDQ